LSFRSAASSREESALHVPLAKRSQQIPHPKNGFGMTRLRKGFGMKVGSGAT
jgi:hypothetical protein